MTKHADRQKVMSDQGQLWRNVEAAKEFAGIREFAVILAVEHEADGISALADGASSLASSYPHLDRAQRSELDRHLLGFAIWADIVKRFSMAVKVNYRRSDGPIGRRRPPTRDLLQRSPA